MFYDLWISGQFFWSGLAWMELHGLGYTHVSRMTGPLSTRSFILQGVSLGVSQGCRRISSSKRGHSPISSTVPVFFKPLPVSYLPMLAKTNHIGSSAWVQRGLIHKGHYWMIYHCMLWTVILTHSSQTAAYVPWDTTQWVERGCYWMLFKFWEKHNYTLWLLDTVQTTTLM